MPYISTIPQPTDRIKDSQPQILANFTAIPTLIEVNHVGFIGGANDGKHTKVDFTANTTHPLVAANQLLLYNNGNELYVKKAGALATPGIPFTKGINATQGYTYLPSGALIQWGATSVTGDDTITIASNPKFTAIYHVQVTSQSNDLLNNNRTVVLRTWTLNAGVSFSLNVTGVQRLSNTPTTVTCYWMVIGV